MMGSCLVTISSFYFVALPSDRTALCILIWFIKQLTSEGIFWLGIFVFTIVQVLWEGWYCNNDRRPR